MKRAAEERIAALAEPQHGVATHRQLIEAGLSASAIKRRVRSGRLRVLHRGVYLTIPFALPRSGEMAAVLASGPHAVLSRFSAAAAWRLARVAPRHPDVSVPGDRGGRRGICVHRVTRLEPDEVTTLEHIPITSPKRTLLDLATVLGVRQLEAVVARAERDGLVTREELQAYAVRKPGRRGASALRRVLAVAGGPAFTRSQAEARLLALVRAARLPTPETNVSLGPYEVDCLWRGAGIAVEVDGFRYHASRDRFEGDRHRDVHLATRGITVIRFTWRQITQEPLATVAQLGQLLGSRATNPR